MKPRFQGRVALLGLAMLLWLSPASYAGLYQVQEDYSWFEQNVTLPQLNQEPEATHGSGPVAAITSFMYLQHRYPEVYHGQLVTNPIVDALLLASSTYMKTSLSGTWVRDFVWGANLFTDARVPGTTVYLGQAVPQGNQSLSNPGGWTAERYKPSWLTEGNPSWWFIFQQLCQGKNVEISLGSDSAEPNFITATGIYFNDSNSDGVMASEENAVLYYIDPVDGVTKQSHIWQTGSGELLQSDFAPGCCITMAVAEGPVPLPSTLLLVSSGGLGLLAWRRRRSSQIQ